MIPYLETHIVDQCNLNCRGCSHFSPLADIYFKPIEEFEQELKRLVEIGEVYTFRIMGEEPLLHPQLIDFCLIARNYMPKGIISIVTNGILLNQLTNEQIQKLNDNKIKIDISNYPLNLDLEILKQFKFKYLNPKNKMYNLCLDLDGKQNYIKAFENCKLVRSKNYLLKQGRIYQCAPMAYIQYFNKYFNKNIEYNLDDISIDIFTHTEEEILNFLKIPHLACKYCNSKKRIFTYKDYTISRKNIKEWTNS